MGILDKSIGLKAQFWVFIGPSLILFSSLVLLFKGTENLWYFPLAAIVGAPLSLRWGMKGLAFALTFLFVLMAYQYSSLPLEDRYWHVGMGMALSLSFVVITLSSEEAESAIGTLQAETKSRLDHIVRLNEQWQSLQSEWTLEKDAMHQKIVVLTHELELAEKKRAASEKLAVLAKEELLIMRECISSLE